MRVAPTKVPICLGCTEVGVQPSTLQQQRGAGFQHHLPEHLVNYHLTAWHQAGASLLSQMHAATVPVKQQALLLIHRFMVRGNLGSRAGGHRAASPLPCTPGCPLVPAAPYQMPGARHTAWSCLGKQGGSCRVSAEISEIFISQKPPTAGRGGRAEQSPAGWQEQQGRGDGGGWGCRVRAHTSLQHPSHSQCSRRLVQLPALSFPCQLPAASGQRRPVGVQCSPPLFPASWETGLLWPSGSRTGASLLLLMMMMPLKTLVCHVKLTLREREGRGALHRCVQLQ